MTWLSWVRVTFRTSTSVAPGNRGIAWRAFASEVVEVLRRSELGVGTDVEEEIVFVDIPDGVAAVDGARQDGVECAQVLAFVDADRPPGKYQGRSHVGQLRVRSVGHRSTSQVVALTLHSSAIMAYSVRHACLVALVRIQYLARRSTSSTNSSICPCQHPTRTVWPLVVR